MHQPWGLRPHRGVKPLRGSSFARTSQTCTQCGQTKIADEVGVRNRAAGKTHRRCKVCRGIRACALRLQSAGLYRAQWATCHRRLWNYLSSHPCVDCGRAEPRVLEFDHREPETKVVSDSVLAHPGGRWANIEAEIAKCDVRCANCHRRRSATQFNWRKRLFATTRRHMTSVDLAGLEPATSAMRKQRSPS